MWRSYQKIILGAFLCLLGGGPLPAATLEVAPTGPLRSLADALCAAADGDTILVHPGTYFEKDLLVDKSVVIRGIDYPVIDAQNDGEVLTVVAGNVTIEGLQVQNVGINYLKDHAGIRDSHARDITIRNNRLANTLFGIYLGYVKRAVVEDNEVTGQAVTEASSGNGIHAWYCTGLRINGNYVSGHRDGIYFEFVDSSSVRGNESIGNLRYGLHFMFSNNDEYHDNVFEDNGAGVALMFSKKIGMSGNHFRYNWGRAAYGLLLKEIYDADIRDNYFTQNTIGINIESSTRVNYTGNTFAGNGWAMKMKGGCLDNIITRNNFNSNTLDLVLGSNANNNTFNGNYWSEYSGYDLDRDGTGDVPHRPVKLFSYILDLTPEAVVLLRSFFIDLINFSEKISPAFTPAGVVDEAPAVKPFAS